MLELSGLTGFHQVDHEVCSIQRGKHDLHLDQWDIHMNTPAAPYLSGVHLAGNKIILLFHIHSCLSVCVFALQTHRMKDIEI